MKQCSLEADLICGYHLWPAEYLQDARELLSLKASASQPAQPILTWRGSVPPCTNSTLNASCSLCSDNVPAEMCGGVWGSGGVQLCNWRHIECRDRRVVTINLDDHQPAKYSAQHNKETLHRVSVAGNCRKPSISTACVRCLQGVTFSSLPAVLANNTVLEQLDLWGDRVMGGVLPEAYSAWINLTVFR